LLDAELPQLTQYPFRNMSSKLYNYNGIILSYKRYSFMTGVTGLHFTTGNKLGLKTGLKKLLDY